MKYILTLLMVLLFIGTVNAYQYNNYPITEMCDSVEINNNIFIPVGNDIWMDNKLLNDKIWVDGYRIEHFNHEACTALIVQRTSFPSIPLSLSIPPRVWWSKYGEAAIGVDVVELGTRVQLHVAGEWEDTLTDKCSFADYAIFGMDNDRKDYGKCSTLNQHSGTFEFSCTAPVTGATGKYYGIAKEYYADSKCGTSGIVYRNKKSPISNKDYITIIKTTVVDTISPSVRITAPISGSTHKTSFLLKADVNDAVGVNKVNVYVDGVYDKAMYTGGQDYYSSSISLRNLEEGTHTILVKAWDSSDNLGTDVINFIVEAEAYTDPNIDSDGDGVSDAYDQCPLVYGRTNNGCPKEVDCAVIGGCNGGNGDKDVCGNSICEDTENKDNCFADCGEVGGDQPDDSNKTWIYIIIGVVIIAVIAIGGITFL